MKNAGPGKLGALQRKSDKIAMVFWAFKRVLTGPCEFFMGSLYKGLYSLLIENQVGVAPSSLPTGVVIAVPDCCV
jgi:hypothetical protein